MGASDSVVQMQSNAGPKSQSTSKVKPVVENENKIFEEQLIACINKYRTLHSVSPLKRSKALTQLAQEWSDRVSQTGIPTGNEASRANIGYTVYWSRWNINPDSVCDSWYKEGRHYRFDKEPDPPPIASVNFTQMLWKNSSEVGVGKTTSWTNVTYVVALYRPRGNTKGDFMKNLRRSTLKLPEGQKVGERKLSVREADANEVTYPQAMGDSNFQKLMLQMTNEFRDIHNTRSLRKSNKLTELAQTFADYMAQIKKLEPPKTAFGSTIYCSKSLYNPNDVCKFWYQESTRFKFDVEPAIIPLSTSNFTQMIWAGTSEVGYGRAKAANGFVFVVALYRPKGNVLGEFKKNVSAYRVQTLKTQSTDEENFDITRKRSTITR